jgi:hypothetical protein
MQPKKATAISSSLVAPRKLPHPHEEKKNVVPFLGQQF